MELETTPPLDPREQRALSRALAQVVARSAQPASYEAAWRRAAFDEGTRGYLEPEAYALSPRSTRGATRA